MSSAPKAHPRCITQILQNLLEIIAMLIGCTGRMQQHLKVAVASRYFDRLSSTTLVILRGIVLVQELATEHLQRRTQQT